MSTIQISKETKELIGTMGSKGESYETIIKRLYALATKEQLREFFFAQKAVPIDDAIAKAKKKWQ